MEPTRRVAGKTVMFVVLTIFGCLAYLGYLQTGDTDMLATSVLSCCIAVFFAWVFIFKKEEWLKDKLEKFF